MAVAGVQDILKAQEMILKEMGPEACVYEKVCAAYAEAAARAKKPGGKGTKKTAMDWEKIIRWVPRLWLLFGMELKTRVTKWGRKTRFGKSIY